MIIPKIWKVIKFHGSKPPTSCKFLLIVSSNPIDCPIIGGKWLITMVNSYSKPPTSDRLWFELPGDMRWSPNFNGTQPFLGPGVWKPYDQHSRGSWWYHLGWGKPFHLRNNLTTGWSKKMKELNMGPMALKFWCWEKAWNFDGKSPLSHGINLGELRTRTPNKDYLHRSIFRWFREHPRPSFKSQVQSAIAAHLDAFDLILALFDALGFLFLGISANLTSLEISWSHRRI